MKIVDTFEKHRSEPDKTLEAYTKSIRLELGKEIRKNTKIYLDTKYWLLLRDAAIKRTENENIYELLSNLQNGVKDGKIICPISEDIFIEVLKSDLSFLKETVNLIDSLSKGVSILSERERLDFETLHFILENFKGEESVYSPDVFIWNKLSYVLGTVHPTSTPFTTEEELVIQKAFFDQMWTISLSKMVEIMGMENIMSMPQLNDLSSQLNDDKIEYAHENKSFKQVYLSELAGALDLCIPTFEDAVVYLFKKEYGYNPNATEKKSANSGKQIANAIYNLFKKNKLKTYFPTLVIGAGLHASIRWDLKRQFKKNDLHDIRHAQTALPYFDIFLTEHSLRDLVTRKNIKFHEKYNCNVYSHPNEAIECVKKLRLRVFS